MASEFMLPVHCILSYPNLFTPKPPAEGAEPRYSCIFVISEEMQNTNEWQLLRQGVHACAVEEWGSELPSNLKWPFRKCSEKADKGEPFSSHAENGIFLSPWTKNRPGIVGPDRSEILVPSDVFGGQLARAKVSPFTWTHRTGGKGVSLSLGNIQITVPNMPRIGGGSHGPAKDDFDAVAETDSVAAGADDELPF